MKSSSENAVALVTMIDLLIDRNMTMKEIMSRTGISERTTLKWVGILKRKRRVRVVELRKPVGRGRPTHVLGWVQ